VCVNMSLFQEIKDVPIYSKDIHKSCLNNHGRKNKDPPIFRVVSQLVDLMIANFFTTNYVELGNHVVYVHINNTYIPNTLIDLGVSINVMRKGTMGHLKLSNLQKTLMVL
jgi:hypothetical protein